MGTYIRVVGFGEDGVKLVNRLRRNVKNGPFGEKTDFEQLDFITFGCSDYRENIEKCFVLDDFSQKVDHKLMLLVTREEGPVVGSIVHAFRSYTKNSGWDFGTMIIRSNVRKNNGLPEWAERPNDLCDFYAILPVDDPRDCSFSCIEGLVYALKNSGVVRFNYNDFMKLAGGGEELKFQCSYAHHWVSEPIMEMESCLMLIKHSADFTMVRMLNITNKLSEGVECIISNANVMEEGCPAIVNIWYK